MNINRNRRSIRLKGYDYAAPGAYFITLVTWQRNDLFGQIVNGDMILSGLGKIAHDEWFRSAAIRNEIRLYEDEFIIMPNHLHSIVWIIEASHEGVDGIRGSSFMDLHVRNNINATHMPQRRPKSLSSFITGYKSSVTSHAKKELDMTGIWQRNYYDDIIRNDDDFSKIWDYIDTNTHKWDEDILHTGRDG